jgi:glutathione S-transferase
MHLYTFDPAPNPRRLGLFLAHKGIEIDSTQVDLMKLEQLGEAFRRINPLGTVPALQLDDGTLLTEVIGMCDYLESLHPERPLMGTTPLARAQVLSWDHQIYMSAFTAIAEILRNGNPAFADRALPGPIPVAQIPELVERGRQRLRHVWKGFNAALTDRDFLVGDSPTLADIDLLVCIEFAGWVKESVPEEYSALLDWRARARQALAGD